MKIILGPCRCQGCGQMVVWTGWEWRTVGEVNRAFHHRCELATMEGSQSRATTKRGGAGADSSVPAGAL